MDKRAKYKACFHILLRVSSIFAIYRKDTQKLAVMSD